MGVPASEVGYIIATARRETTKVHKNMWWYWGGEVIPLRKPYKGNVFLGGTPG